MAWLYFSAPAHTRMLCAGAFAFCMQLAACDKPPIPSATDRTLELNEDTVEIDAGVTLHNVRVRASQISDFSPSEITARRGDIIRFISVDLRMHGLVIHGPGAAALQRSGQQRSPPLVARNQAWIVSLNDLPVGTYRVSCISHAGTLTLMIQ